MAKVDESVWFEFVESKIFSKQVRELPAEILTNIQSDLVQNPERGDVSREHMAFGRREWLTQIRHEARAAVIATCISILNTPAEFTCFTCSAKGEQANLSPDQKRSIGILSQQIRKERES